MPFRKNRSGQYRFSDEELAEAKRWAVDVIEDESAV
jgi:hypothetical protein